MTLYIDRRWHGKHGIGRYATEVISRLDLPSSNYPVDGSPLSLLGQLKPFLPRFNLNKNDVYYSPGFSCPLANPCKTFVTLHDLIHLNFKEEQSTAKTLYYSLLKRKLLQAPLVFTVSEYSKHEIQAWLGKRYTGEIIVTGNGLSDAFHSNLRTTQPFTQEHISVYIPGSEKAHKNILAQLQACSINEYKDLISVYLTGIFSDDFKIQAAKTGLNVHYLGFVSETELARLYAKVDLVLFCSLYEGFGLPIIEAESQATPVITSNITSMPEIAGPNTLFADPTCVEDISHNISIAIKHPQLNSPNNLTKHQWDAVAKTIQDSINLYAN